MYQVVEHYGEMSEHAVAHDLESPELAREFIAAEYTAEECAELRVTWIPEDDD